MKKRKIWITCLLLIIMILLAVGIRIYRDKHYAQGMDFLSEGEYLKAEKEFDKILGFKDADNYVVYCEALYDMQVGNYEVAKDKLSKIHDFIDSDSLIEKINEIICDDNKSAFELAKKNYDEGNYRDALIQFQVLDKTDEVLEYISLCKQKIREELGSQIEAGVQYVIGIDKNEGVKLAWNNQEQFNFDGWDNLISIAGKGDLILGLDGKGKVYWTYSWEYESEYDVEHDEEIIQSWQNKDVVQVVAGEKNAYALFMDGTIDGIGRNTYRNDCEFRKWSGIVQIASSRRTLVALNNDGELKFYGQGENELTREYEQNKQQWNDIVKIVVGGEESPYVLGIRKDGCIVGLYDLVEHPIVNDDWQGHVKDIAAGDDHTVVLLDDDTIEMYGNTGVLEYEGKDIREKVWECEKPKVISAGTCLSVAVSETGEVYVSGYDSTGQMLAKEWNDNIIPCL